MAKKTAKFSASRSAIDRALIALGKQRADWGKFRDVEERRKADSEETSLRIEIEKTQNAKIDKKKGDYYNSKFSSNSTKISCKLGNFYSLRHMSESLGIQRDIISHFIKCGKIDDLCDIITNDIYFNGKRFSSLREVADYLGHKTTMAVAKVFVTKKATVDGLSCFSKSDAEKDGWRLIRKAQGEKNEKL